MKLAQLAPPLVVASTPISVPTRKLVAGELRSKIAVSAGILGNPVAGALMSVQFWPKSLDRKTRLPGPVVLKPDAVIITIPDERGETATEVSGKPATSETPCASLGVISVNVGLGLVEFLLTHACGPIVPSELVTT